MGFEKKLEGLGLTKIQSLDQIIYSGSYIVDSNYGVDEFSVFPITKKYSKDLLNLYGTHWRYVVNDDLEISQIEGDVNIVLDDIRKGNKFHRHPAFASTQRYVNLSKTL